MGSTAKGRPALVGGADVFDADLIPDPGLLAAIVGDYWWGTGVAEATSSVEIPYSWISPPLQRRPSVIVNDATVSQSGGVTAYSNDATSTARYGVNAASVQLETSSSADPASLAAFLTTYYAQPRPRQPILQLNLYNRTEPECMRILGVGLAERVRITGAPAGWPPGAVNFTVEGIRHVGAVERRTVEWATAAIVGSAATDPGPWFRWDASFWDGTDLRPF